jgi:glyoxylase-like metal-dependent hydrolase (beta-lactamase superfamily II)
MPSSSRAREHVQRSPPRAGERLGVAYHPAVDEVRAGVWHWQAPHPDWKPGTEWGELVSSYALDDGERLLLFDPLAPPSDLDRLASERETAIVLTDPWHARDAVGLAEQLGVPLYVPPPDEGNRNPVPGTVFRAGEQLPVGVEAYPGFEPNDLVLWVERSAVLVVGDTLVDRGRGLEFPADWVSKDVAPPQILEGLQPLLELPVELVLATHGGPFDRNALERALS